MLEQKIVIELGGARHTPRGKHDQADAVLGRLSMNFFKTRFAISKRLEGPLPTSKSSEAHAAEYQAHTCHAVG